MVSKVQREESLSSSSPWGGFKGLKKRLHYLNCPGSWRMGWWWVDKQKGFQVIVFPWKASGERCSWGWKRGRCCWQVHLGPSLHVLNTLEANSGFIGWVWACLPTWERTAGWKQCCIREASCNGHVQELLEQAVRRARRSSQKHALEVCEETTVCRQGKSLWDGDWMAGAIGETWQKWTRGSVVECEESDALHYRMLTEERWDDQ